MAGRLTEEQVTKTILNWLESAGWQIVCYDFPQSGTGRPLHLNSEKRSGKNLGAIIPDIVAVKNRKAVFFENKDRYVDADVVKFTRLKSGDYSEAISNLLQNNPADTIYFGIGIPASESPRLKERLNTGMIDFSVFVNSSMAVTVCADPQNVF
jgi:hypothetical protein